MFFFNVSITKQGFRQRRDSRVDEEKCPRFHIIYLVHTYPYRRQVGPRLSHVWIATKFESQISNYGDGSCYSYIASGSIQQYLLTTTASALDQNNTTTVHCLGDTNTGRGFATTLTPSRLTSVRRRCVLPGGLSGGVLPTEVFAI